MRRRSLAILLGLIFLYGGLCGPLMAEEVKTLKTVTVEAPKIRDIRESAAKVSRSGGTFAATPVDTLSEFSGIDVRQRALLTPQQSMIRLRGFDESRSLILLGDRPLNGTGVMGGYYVDWSMISMDDLESVEVLRGGATAEYGNTLGGVIRLVPKQPEQGLHFSVQGGAQRYGTYQGRGRASFRNDWVGLSLTGEHLETDGFLRNSQVDRDAFSTSLSFYLPKGGEITFRLGYTDGDYHFPMYNRPDGVFYDPSWPDSDGTYLAGPGLFFKADLPKTSPAYNPYKTWGEGSYYNKKRLIGDASFKKEIFGVKIQADLYFNSEDRKEWFYAADTGACIIKRETHPDKSWGWQVKAAKTVGSHRLKAGVEGNHLGYGSLTYHFIDPAYLVKIPTDGPPRRNEIKRHGAFVQDYWGIGEKLELYGGVRVDHYKAAASLNPALHTPTKEVKDTVVSPKFGVYLYPFEGVEIFSTVGRSTRFPTAPEFYWYFAGYDPSVQGLVRKPLTYEDAMQYEVGTRVKPVSGLETTLRGYYYDVDDYIRTIFGYKPSRVVYNIDHVRFLGVEGEVSYRFWKYFSCFANVTYEKTKKKGDILDNSNALTDKLPEIPEWKFNLGAQYARPDGTLVKVTYRWVDDRAIPVNSATFKPLGSGCPSGACTLGRMDAYGVVDVYLRYPFLKKRVKGYLIAGCNNLFDERYEETYGYPMPHRMWFAGLKFDY